MATIKPTVGRIVWYYPNRFDLFPQNGKGQPHAAIIAWAKSETEVNLSVLDAHGVPHGKTSVLLVQPGVEAPTDTAYCTWMPYQIGQAAATKPAETK